MVGWVGGCGFSLLLWGSFPGVTDVGSAYQGTVFKAGDVLGTVLGAGDSGVKQTVLTPVGSQRWEGVSAGQG